MEQSITLSRKLVRTKISSIDECLMSDELIVCKTYNSLFLRKLFADYSEDEFGMPTFITGRSIFDRERVAYEKLSSSPNYLTYFPRYFGHFTDSKKNAVLAIERACGSLMQLDGPSQRYLFTSPSFEERCGDLAFLKSTVRRLLESLNQMHLLRLAHLDIKPDNFLVFGEEVRLADFNCSREFARGGKAKGAYGSFRFAAPETLDAQPEGFDPFKADVWALGACLFAFFTRTPPFQRENDPTEGFQAAYEARALTEEAELERVPGEFRGLLKEMLNRDWNNRLECAQLISSGLLD